MITYVAVDRGKLAPGHTAGQEQQIETAFEQFQSTLTAKGDHDETLDGTPEGWLDALQEEWQIVTDLVLPGDVAEWREFMSSVLNTETFSIDFTGTIANPGTSIDGWLTDRRIQEQQIAGAGFKYRFTFKAL